MCQSDGSKAAESLIQVASAGSSGLVLEGYISGALGMRSNRKGQHFFVNGRPVKNAAIEAALGGAYREYAEPGRFPAVFLFVTLAPEMVDVNVHPAKNEISFVNTKEIAEFIEKSIRETLQSERSIPKLSVQLRPKEESVFRFEPPEKKEIIIGKASETTETIEGTQGPRAGLCLL